MVKYLLRLLYISDVCGVGVSRSLLGHGGNEAFTINHTCCTTRSRRLGD